MKITTVTSKFQATIPKEIREALKLEAGDKIIFSILSDGTISIKKLQPFDVDYLEALGSTLSEWKSKNDEEAYEHLQDL